MTTALLQHNGRYVVLLVEPQTGTQALDTDWAAEQLREFCRLDSRSRTGSNRNLEEAQRQEDELRGALELVEHILPLVLPGWKAADESLSLGFRVLGTRQHVARALPLLARAAEIQEKLGGAPTLSAIRLHPWTWEGAQSMWRSRHYRQGVVDGLKRVNAEAQNKTGRHDLSETKLFRPKSASSGQAGRGS